MCVCFWRCRASSWYVLSDHSTRCDATQLPPRETEVWWHTPAELGAVAPDSELHWVRAPEGPRVETEQHIESTHVGAMSKQCEHLEILYKIELELGACGNRSRGFLHTLSDCAENQNEHDKCHGDVMEWNSSKLFSIWSCDSCFC